MAKVISYEELVLLLIKETENINISSFCKEHNIKNQSLMYNIRNKTATKEYPKFVINILKCFGYKITKYNGFIIE